MTTTTVQEKSLPLGDITKAKIKYSTYTKEDFQKLTVSPSKVNPKVLYIRQIAASIGISANIVKKGKKDDLITLIMKECEPFKNKEIKTKIVYKRDEIINDIVDVIYKDRDNNIGFNTYLKNCFLKGTTALTLTPAFQRLFLIFKPTLEKHLQANVGDYTDSTFMAYKRDVLNCLKDRLKSDFEGHDWKSFYDSYNNSLRMAFNEVTAKIRKKSLTSLGNRQNSIASIQCSQAIITAREVLENLRTHQKFMWREVVCALMLVTGRRQAEILQSGDFELTDDDYQVMFSGQLKKHNDLQATPYMIPVLVPAQLVIDGIEWLNKQGKRDCDTPRQANAKYSKEICATSKSIIENRFVLTEGDWFYDDNGKKKDRRVGHLFRHVYGQVCYKLFSTKSKYINNYLTEIYGHDSDESGTSSASANYLSKVNIGDRKRELESAVFE